MRTPKSKGVLQHASVVSHHQKNESQDGNSTTNFYFDSSEHILEDSQSHGALVRGMQAVMGKQVTISEQQFAIEDYVEEVKRSPAIAQTQPSMKIGTWKRTKADQIEDYLLGSQRKFAKYRLNIFYLNKVSLFFNHLDILLIRFSSCRLVCLEDLTRLL